MKTYKTRPPKRFKYQLCEYVETLKELESVIEPLEKYNKEYVILKRKGGYAVFTKGEDLMSKDEEQTCRIRYEVKKNLIKFYKAELKTWDKKQQKDERELKYKIFNK